MPVMRFVQCKNNLKTKQALCQNYQQKQSCANLRAVHTDSVGLSRVPIPPRQVRVEGDVAEAPEETALYSFL